MIKIEKKVSLAKFTTMHVGGDAKFFVVAKNSAEVLEALKFAKKSGLEVLLLANGSNIIVSDKGFNGLVLKLELTGKVKLLEDDAREVWDVAAGETWDKFVSFSVRRGLYGLENLSYIPGSVGASVVQNIGAYGQEVSTSVVEVNVIDRKFLKVATLKVKKLKFGYRKSLFNTGSGKGRYVILSVVFSLNKKSKLELSYGDLDKYFMQVKVKPTLASVRGAVIKIRNRKFPLPSTPTRGNVGSFFNALPVSGLVFKRIVKKIEQMGLSEKAEYLKKMENSFKVAQGYKVPYGILIEALGLKGRTYGGVKILESHGGVILNHTARARAKDVLGLAKVVIGMVEQEFSLRLRVEPELVGFTKKELGFFGKL